MNPESNSSNLFKNRGVLVPLATSRKYRWSVDYHWLLLQTDQFICSDTFKVPSLPNSLFYLWLCLEENSLSLSVCRNNRIRSSHPRTKNDSVHIVLTIEDSNGIFKSEELNMMDDSTPPIQIKQFKMGESSISKEHLEINCTVINNELQSPKSQKARSEDFTENYIPRISCSELKEHLQVMLDGDVENCLSISVGEEVFQVHKKLLCTNSIVFNAMFQHETLEKNENLIYINDVSSEAFGEILSYIYFGNTRKMSQELCIEVYIAADKYAIMHLKKQCSNNLIANFNRDKILDLHLLADRHGDRELKEACMEYLVKKVPDVIETDFFVQFVESEPDIARNIITYLLKSKKLDY